MTQTAYNQGCAEALVRFKVAGAYRGYFPRAPQPRPLSPAGRAGLLGLLAAIPVGSAALSGATAPDGEGLSSAAATGLGSVAGGTAGGYAGMVGGAHLGKDHPITALTLAALGGLLGGATGQLGGAALGHAAHKSWRGKDKPGPASPGEKTEADKKASEQDDSTGTAKTVGVGALGAAALAALGLTGYHGYRYVTAPEQSLIARKLIEHELLPRGGGKGSWYSPAFEGAAEWAHASPKHIHKAGQRGRKGPRQDTLIPGVTIPHPHNK